MPAARPRLDKTTQYGHPATGSFWVEYPDGTVDVTRTHPLTAPDADAPPKQDKHIEVAVDGDRKVRFDPARAAIVIIDMQKYAVPSCHLFEPRVK